MDRIDVEPLFDSEYFLDLQSYADPLAWEDLWRSSTGGYRVNGASLDCCELLLRQDFKYERRLTRTGLTFKFRYSQDEDKDRPQTYYLLELEQNLGLGLALAVFGEPSFKKEDSDAGLGASWSLGDPLTLSARHLWVDFSFNQRGSTTQRYSLKPHTQHFSAESRLGRHLLSAWLELDYPLRLEIPAETRTYSYRRTTLKTQWRRDLAAGGSWLLGYDFEFQVEQNRLAPDPQAASVEFRRRVHRVTTSAELSLGPRDRLEAGHVLLARAARNDNPSSASQGIVYRRWEAQPYARWRRELRPWLATELSPFLSFGENRKRYGAGIAPGFNSVLAEAKLGAGAEFLFPGSGRLALFGTFDLDELGRHPWDGGSARAVFLF